MKPPIETLPRRMFHDAARGQKVCRMCGRGGPFQAHHVLLKQTLAREGAPLWTAANALRVCHECHARHHQRVAVIPLMNLTQANIDFAFDLLGAYAFDYLSRHYAGTDPRVDNALSAAEQKETNAA